MVRKMVFCVLIVSVCVTVLSSAYAGKVELTTYYPAPYGEYTELKSTGNASFAASVAGSTATVGSASNLTVLAVNNTLTLAPVSGDASVQLGGSEGSLRYSSDAGGPGVGGVLCYSGGVWKLLADAGGGGGGPIFLPSGPVTIITVPTITGRNSGAGSHVWEIDQTTYNVPKTATAIILEAEGSMGGPDGDPSLKFARIWFRLFNSTANYVLLKGAAAGGGDETSFGGQGTFPLDGSGYFLIEISPYTFNYGATVRIVGYYR